MELWCLEKSPIFLEFIEIRDSALNSLLFTIINKKITEIITMINDIFLSILVLFCKHYTVTQLGQSSLLEFPQQTQVCKQQSTQLQSQEEL